MSQKGTMHDSKPSPSNINLLQQSFRLHHWSLDSVLEPQLNNCVEVGGVVNVFYGQAVSVCVCARI